MVKHKTKWKVTINKKNHRRESYSFIDGVVDMKKDKQGGWEVEAYMGNTLVGENYFPKDEPNSFKKAKKEFENLKNAIEFWE